MPAVELLVGVAGADFSWAPGEIVEMDDAGAAAWADGIRGRLHTPVGPPPTPADEPAPVEVAGDEGTDEPDAAIAVPPKNGAGSGVEAWRAYAEAHQVEVPADAKREQIWAALADAGVPTEPAPAAEPDDDK
jgi:hypothetical protein